MADQPSDTHDVTMNGADSKTIEPQPNGALVGAAEGETETETETEEQQVPFIYHVIVKLPHAPFETKFQVASHEQVQDLRQTITDFDYGQQYSCFHLEINGERINDYVELSEVPAVQDGSVLTLVEDPYNEKDARLHFVRTRELIGAGTPRLDPSQGIAAGLSLVEDVVPFQAALNGQLTDDDQTQRRSLNVDSYDFDAPGTVKTLLPPPQEQAPKVVNSISISPWNPPPYHLRARGHHLYIMVSIKEGEFVQITSHVSGFYVNNCTKDRFDPSPRPGKNLSAHSLLTLLSLVSASFSTSLKAYQKFLSMKDGLVIIPPSHSIPSSPWLVSAPSSATAHQADVTRSQEPYLFGGVDGADSIRDWNEEFQTTREMPKETMQDQVFRERMVAKQFADFNEAATRGAVLVARGEVVPLNPTEGRDAQIFVHNSIFFSFGADGVGTFVTDGGDEAARVATGKDAIGVKAVNQLDITGLFTPGTTVVDYLGRRIVAQSIVPGIFKQREPGEHQIDYGGVEGKDVVASHEGFAPLLEKLSEEMHVKKHPVWDKEGKRHDLESSIETKGLLGTDGRKYVLDLYRITPLDIPWLEGYWSEIDSEKPEKDPERDYPHRMAVLRQELITSYYRFKLQEFVTSQLTGNSETNGHEKKEAESKENGTEQDPKPQAEGLEVAAKADETPPNQRLPSQIDVTNFKLTLNPDVFCGQTPQTDEERAEMEKDEAEVRSACDYLTETVIPNLIRDLQEGDDVGFPVDGSSLCTLIHKRGINVRYLGRIASAAEGPNPRLHALHSLAVQEMVARGFKHVVNRKLRPLPVPFASSAISHLLNCLLGFELNAAPMPETDSMLRSLYPTTDFSYEDVTPQSLYGEIVEEVRIRYRFGLGDDLVQPGKHLQLLREVSLKLGIQLEARTYAFTQEQHANRICVNGHAPAALTNGQANGVPKPATSTSSKKKKKGGQQNANNSAASTSPTFPPTTFQPDDVLNVVPIVKEASPRSQLAENAFEGGRLSLVQNNKEVGQSLLLESLSLYEQVYGVLHPEVARAYLQLSSLYYNLDEKGAAVELARKAVIVAERTIGVDSPQAINSYLNLGLFEHATGNGTIALRYFIHALNLLKLVYGPNHPDSITTINNVAVILQSMKRYSESRVWFEASLKVAEEISGKDSKSTATLLFQLSQALALDNDFQGATQRMQTARSLFQDAFGSDHPNTRQANEWLEKLVESAVHRKKQQQLRLASGLSIGPRPRVFAQAGQRSEDLSMGGNNQAEFGRAMAAMDERDISELVKYIEGENGNINTKKGGTSTTPKGKKRNMPKRMSRSGIVSDGAVSR
ncbi:hypothetical protein K402DRAFT_423296 [Aulographum hederae CBS 113979]|uniref:Clustered mitochondria protein homolog n=1 Tax=Aulographum hederae CBS 113979 TaxID=1176131 RepID=A0A6G1GSR9_9PEZI|nr:hypothetical protein K402DRAFT_423296 [Aulographum hederae CBS 113979]